MNKPNSRYVKDNQLLIRSISILSLIVAVSLVAIVCYAANSKPVIRVGSEVEFPPFAVVDKNGQADGFSVDLIKAVAEAMDLPIVITTGSWDAMWNGLVSGKLDVLPIVAKSPERKRLVDFSLIHTETFDAFFVRSGSPEIRDIKAAQGKKIVVMRSDAAHHALLEHNFQGGIVLVDTIPEGLEMIASGKYDAFLCSKLIGSLTIKNHSIEGLIAGPIVPDYKRVFSFGVRKGADELREKLNQGLLIVKSSGEYDRIYEKWLGFDDPWRTYKIYLLSAVVALGFIAVAAVLWSAMLRIAVKRRTAELAVKNKALEQEIVSRKRIEEELRKHKEDLDLLIEERTRSLRTSEAKYHRLFENMTEGYAYCKMIYDDNGLPEDFVYLDVNGAFGKLTGLTDVVGKRVSEAIPGTKESHPELFNIYSRVAKKGLSERFEIEFKPLNLWLDISVFSPAKEHFVAIFDNITERKKAEDALEQYSAELKKSNQELQEALANVKTLSGMLPICASCKKIRDDKGYWSQVEAYISKHTDTVFSHGICPDCEKKAYEELDRFTKRE